jgi:uncharacterized protein YbbK (DUF523 family)
MKLVEEGKAVPVCPEQAGGLSTPRDPSEIQGDRVVSSRGKDVTEQFRLGSEACLQTILAAGCQEAILKENSPSCGVHSVYDGTFSGQRVKGCGIFTRMCREAGIMCRSEREDRTE